MVVRDGIETGYPVAASHPRLFRPAQSPAFALIDEDDVAASWCGPNLAYFEQHRQRCRSNPPLLHAHQGMVTQNNSHGGLLSMDGAILQGALAQGVSQGCTNIYLTVCFIYKSLNYKLFY
jgi:hypothetical protein